MNHKISRSIILGFFIGIAIVVPGVSGSTISVLFNLYDKILYSISNLFKKFKESILFLFPIMIGVIIGFILGLMTLKQLINILPFSITSLFAGLMIGSFPIISKEIKNEKINIKRIILLVLGLIIPLIISIISTNYLSIKSIENLKIHNYLIFIFIGYLVALTQIIPGLSATALLMSLGYFKPILESISVEYIINNPTIILLYISIIVGFIIGMLTLSKLITFILTKRKKETYFLIVGLSISSIISMFYNPDIYSVYISWINGNIIMIYDISIGVILFILGIILSKKLIKNNTIDNI